MRSDSRDSPSSARLATRSRRERASSSAPRATSRRPRAASSRAKASRARASISQATPSAPARRTSAARSPAVDAGAPGPGPGQGLRERVAGLVPLRPRQVRGVRAVPREVEHRVGQDAGGAPLRLGRLLEAGALGRRGVGSLDDLDVAAHVEGFLGERERAGGGETEPPARRDESWERAATHEPPEDGLRMTQLSRAGGPEGYRDGRLRRGRAEGVRGRAGRRRARRRGLGDGACARTVSPGRVSAGPAVSLREQQKQSGTHVVGAGVGAPGVGGDAPRPRPRGPGRRDRVAGRVERHVGADDGGQQQRHEPGAGSAPEGHEPRA